MRSYVYDPNGDELQNVKSVTYKGAVNADVDLRPGCVASACITVTVYGSQSDSVSPGDRIDLFQNSKYNNDDIYVGRFYAEPIVASKNTYQFTAYDAAQKLNADFSARLAEIQDDFPMTLSDLVLEACSVAGVTLDDDEFPMYDTQIQAFYANGITCRNILSYAAEIACCFVRVKPMTDYDDDETIEFAWYESSEGYRIYPSSGTSGGETRVAYKEGGLQYSNYTIEPPPQVAVKPSGVDGAAYIYPPTVSGVYATDPSGNGVITLHNLTAVDDGNGNIVLSGDFEAADSNDDGNVVVTSSIEDVGEPLIISDNILLTGASAQTYNDVAENIYTRMNLIPTFHVATASLFPYENPFMLGQIIPVTDAQGVSFYMLSTSVEIGDSSTVFESTGNETRASEPSDTQKALTQLASDIVQINKLKVGWAEIDQAIINVVEANELKSSDFVPANDGIYAASGMGIDLANKEIKAEEFAVGSDGKLYASAADIGGISFSKSYFYSNLLWPTYATQDGYSLYGAITYRTLVSLGINGLSRDTVDALFEYYNNNAKVHSVEVSGCSVSNFEIPIYRGEADSVVIGLKLLAGETAKIATKNIARAVPAMSAPSGAIVTFGGGISVAGTSIDSTFLGSLISAQKITVGTSSSGYIYVGGNLTRGVLFTSSRDSSVRGAYLWAFNSDGTFSSTPILSASNITLTGSDGDITIANGSSTNYAYVMCIGF